MITLLKCQFCNHAWIPRKSINAARLCPKCKRVQKEVSPYQVAWSEENKQYIGTNKNYPSLSCISDSSIDAFDGIKKLVEKYKLDILKELHESVDIIINKLKNIEKN